MDHTTPGAEAAERSDDTEVEVPTAPIESGDNAGAQAELPEPTLQPDAGAPIGPPPQSPAGRLRDTGLRPEPAVRPLDPPAASPGVFRPAGALRTPPSAVDGSIAPQRTNHGPAIAIGVLSGVLGAALTVAGLAVGGVFDRPETIVQQVAAPVPPPAQIVVSGESSTTAAAVAQKVVPSIVAVEVATANGDDSFDSFGSGSGVVLTGDGLIVTNHHVIADADLAQVVLQNGVIYQAVVIGSDPVTDLAVLQIQATGLTPVELGSTDALSIGDQAVAIGNPLGLPGGASVTVGVVSAFDREVAIGNRPNDRLFGMLQTDAPITRGSSGGALVDSEGRLIGITTAIGVTADAGAEGVGFAIPVELVTRITDEIIEQGYVQHTFLGVLLQDNFEDREGARVPEGAVIIDFVDPSGAQDAGLDLGDRLTTINGRTVHTKEDIINELRKFRVGQAVTFDVDRDGTMLVVEVILGERPDDL